MFHANRSPESTSTESNFTNTIGPVYGSSSLCRQGEPRLAEAFTDDALIVVNGLMLVKFSGETVGVALREEALPGGTTKLETWYEVAYGKTEGYKCDAIRAAFLRGDTHVTLPGITKWAELREVRADEVCPGEDLTQKAQEAAERLQPGTPMPRGLTREEYLKRYPLVPMFKVS